MIANTDMAKNVTLTIILILSHLLVYSLLIDMIDCKSLEEKIESIFTEFNNQIDNQILKMVMASDKAQKLFIENIGFASMISELRENFKQMNFHSKLDDYSMNIIFDMTFSLVEDTVYKLLKRKITKEQAIQEVDIKLHILTFGIYGKPYIVK